MGARHRLALYLLYGLSGFTALALQVVWQRVIGLHAGVDLFSITTVITAFMAGLGLGNLAGGALADRLGPRRSLVAFAVSKAALGAFGIASIPLLYDGYRALAPHIDSLWVAFLFHFALLLVPTTLMGVSLPLVSRGVVEASSDMAARVGRLYAVNTVGAALGAFVAGWFLLGALGFTGTVWVASVLNLAMGALIFVLWQVAPGAAERSAVAVATAPASEGTPATERPVWPWMAAYAFTGAAALGLELVFFRLVDGVMRSNSYSFGHVLAIYLLLFGAGAAWGARRAPLAERPDRTFLWLQFGVGLASVIGVVLLVNAPATFGIRKMITAYFNTDGYADGMHWPSNVREARKLIFSHLLAPLLLMGPSVFLMGASFPFIHAQVARRVDVLGRRTGSLLTANIAGNVIGSLIVGFLLLDTVGTSGALAVLAGALSLCGLVAAATYGTWALRMRAGVGALVAAVLVLVALPSNERLWGFLHSAPEGGFVLHEDRTCVNTLVRHDKEWHVYINASSQNGFPYDDFHVLIGLVPSLMHERPERVFAVGLGAGSTAYGLSQDPRIQKVRCVEICAGQKPLLGRLAQMDSPETARLFSDPRVNIQIGDGRKALLSATERYDVITVDALRPTTAYSGNIYSVEFYELVRSRLNPGGFVATWLPTDRTTESLRRVFPHMLVFDVLHYNNSRFVVASAEPIRFDREKVLERLKAIDLHRAFPSGQHASLPRYLSEVQPRLLEGEPARAEERINRDLHARDEYFLNN
jgi:predicted membrane-bound spermidine synthase